MFRQLKKVMFSKPLHTYFNRVKATHVSVSLSPEEAAATLKAFDLSLDSRGLSLHEIGLVVDVLGKLKSDIEVASAPLEKNR